MSEATQKCGLVVLIGRSNVGKSTLLNALVGSKVAITSPKPQTTRHVIQGVLNEPRGQIVFADTPGVFKRAPDRLTSRLNEKVKESVTGIDAAIYVVDATRHVGEEEKAVRRLIAAVDQPKFLVLNKRDRRLEFKDEYLALADDFDGVFEVSALQGKGLKPLVDAIFERLPVGEPLYPADRLSDVSHRFWLEEIIREKIFLATEKEVPYSVAVRIEDTAERANGLVYVRAVILTTATRYRQMLIGRAGSKIKEIGSMARRELELITGRKFYLELEVEVDENWQERFE